jgi:stearoyl-CoA desaturase (delta-9 desaturase)
MINEDPISTPRVSRLHQAVVVVGVVVPFLGLIAAVSFWWGRGLSWTELSLFLGMYIATGLGVTVGYHRLFTHRSFETVRPVKVALAVLGSMAIEGPVLTWAAVHRRHHQHSDEAGDPHSPNHYGGGTRGVLTGLWHAHIGWMFAADPPNLAGYVADLREERLVRVVSRLFGVWALLGLLIPTVLGGLLTGTWTGAFLGFIWGGLVRIFFVHHATWSINSVCHLWGRRPFKSRDLSRNNFLFGVVGLGEGWHNNHHAFPASARHGLRWWELDVSYLVIEALRLVGLAWRVRLPGAEAMAAKRLSPA